MKTYYDTLWELFEDLEMVYKIELPLITGGIKYEESQSYHFDIGHKTKQLHVQIYRRESGIYEYNGYILWTWKI